MTKNEPPTRLTDRKRAAILDAAVSEFRSHGFDNTSMDQIAAAAAVSKRTVYNHFPSKEALFTAIVDALRSRSDVMREYPYDPDRSLEDQLTEIGRSAIALFASDDFQSLARVILSRFMQSPQLARTMMGQEKHPDARVLNWIRAAQEDGRVEVQNPKWAAKQFMGLINSIAFWPQIIGSEPPIPRGEREAIVESAVAMFLKRYAT